MWIHVCGVQTNFFFNFYFLAQIQGAPKSNIKKKLTHGRQFIFWIGKSESKKSNDFLKRKVAYVTIYYILKKNQKKNGERLKIHWKNGLFSRCFLGH